MFVRVCQCMFLFVGVTSCLVVFVCVCLYSTVFAVAYECLCVRVYL